MRSSKSPHRNIATVFPLPFVFFSVVQSWTYPQHVDMSYPPISQSGFVNNTTPTPQTYPNHDLIFKCDLHPVDEKTIRVPFPVDSGHIGLDLTDGGEGPPPKGYYANVQVSIGQITRLKLDEPLDSAVADSGENWQDFTPRRNCSTFQINATERVNILGGGQLPAAEMANIVGWNATIEADISVSTQLGDELEQMYQCGYVTFVSLRDFLEEFDGYCGPRKDQAPSSSGGASVTSTNTEAGSETATPTPSGDQLRNGSDNGLSRGMIGMIGMIVALSVVGFILLMVALWYLRQRSKKKKLPPKGIQDLTVNREETAEAANDVDEEQPPTYVEATEKGPELAGENKEKPEKMQANHDEIAFQENSCAEGSSKCMG